jgi:hypothetical protein
MSKPPDEFLVAYGDALRRWAYLEVQLAIWFRKVAMIHDWDTACAIFFSARSFQGRSDMFAAALDAAPGKPDQIAFLRDAYLKVVAYNSARNEIAHGVIHPSEGGPTITRGAEFTKPGPVSIKHLETAAANFRSLYAILNDAHEPFADQPPRERLQELHARLRQLPNEAYSSVPSRKQRGRERQRQSALRSKSKP